MTVPERSIQSVDAASHGRRRHGLVRLPRCALLDAMRSGLELKALGLETKVVPREKGL